MSKDRMIRKSLGVAVVAFASQMAAAIYLPLAETDPDRIVDNGAKVEIRGGDVLITATEPLAEVKIEWRCDFPDAIVLGDQWERTYGDTYWRPVRIPRSMPWYFLCKDGTRTDGYGVMTQPNAFASFRTDGHVLTLTIDVRAAGRPVELKGRTLKAVTLVSRKGRPGESAFAAGTNFCMMMCPHPRLPKDPVYGYNDWYCAYGVQTAEAFLRDAKAVIELCKGSSNPPFAVVDDGWQRNGKRGDGGWGAWAWTESSPHFGKKMSDLARNVELIGAKPGLWYRPFQAWPGANAEELLPCDERRFDPTVPAVRSRIAADIRRFREWGMKLVKVDFLTHDITGTWPCDFGEDIDRLVVDDRSWRDSSRTTVEVLKEVYRVLRENAGDDMVIVGCNALNHLAAGLFEVQRTGDDTSGKSWFQTRFDGVNALGMRSVQNGTFFQADPDCVGLAERGAVAWEKNAQWMDAVARSGQALFVSWKSELIDESVRKGLRAAFSVASRPRSNGEPLDWEIRSLPRAWRFADGTATYDWSDPEPLADSKLQRLCQRLVDEAVATGEQGGVQFCAYQDGKCIVDVCAGLLSTNAGAPKVTKDSLFPIFSTEKPMLATAVHKAVQLGQMDYDEPLCTWWPEMTGEGKEKLTLRETLAYRTGMPGRRPGRMTRRDLVDWPRVVRTAAADKPELEPGTKQRYMPMAYAWFLGHPLEVATKMSLNDALREYSLVPAGIDEEFYFACGDAEMPRIADFCEGTSVCVMNEDWARRTCMPSSWAVASARSIARFYNQLCGYNGYKSLIDAERLEEAVKPCRHPSDPLPEDMNEKMYMVFGMGYGLWGERDNVSRVIGHGGLGGSEGLVDLEKRLVVGYTCNFDNFKRCHGALRKRLYAAVGMKWRYWNEDDADIQGIQMQSYGKVYEPTWESLDSRPIPQWWRDAKFGIFVHWGPYAVPAYAPTDATNMYKCYAEWYHGRLIGKDSEFVDHHKRLYGSAPYGNFAANFKAENFNPGEWAELFRKSGARYVVLTAKHHDGYALWPSGVTPYYNSVAIGSGRDLAGEFTAAMKKAGLRSGFYYSLLEYANPLCPKKRDGLNGAAVLPMREWAARMNLPQMKELVENYKADVIWPDGEWDWTDEEQRSAEFLSWLYNNSSVKDSVVVNDRWGAGCRGHHGGYYTTEYGNAAEGIAMTNAYIHPWEECRGIGNSFGYNRYETPVQYMSSEKCIETLVSTVSRGGNLLLNVGPTADGRIPVIMQDRLLSIGRWLDVNGEAIYGSTRWEGADSRLAGEGVYFTKKDNAVYVIVTRPRGNEMSIANLPKVKSVAILGSERRIPWRSLGSGIAFKVPPESWVQQSGVGALAIKISL